MALYAMPSSSRRSSSLPWPQLSRVLAWREGIRLAALLLGAAALVYLVGGIGVTGFANVPLNEALAAIETPLDPARAATVWSEYSEPWQAYNLARTLASFLSFGLAAVGLMYAGSTARTSHR